MIRVKQIDNSELTTFVQAAVSGASFSGNLNAYVNAGGYLGSNVVYASGRNQTISGDKTFDLSPTVPYSGTTGRVVARKYIDDLVGVLSGSTNTFFVSKTQTDDLISGQKTFTGALGVGMAVGLGDAINLRYLTGVSGALGGGGVGTGYSGYVEGAFVHRFGAESISGQKTFVNDATFSNGVTVNGSAAFQDASFASAVSLVGIGASISLSLGATSSFPTPSNNNEAVPLGYLLDVSGALASQTPVLVDVMFQTGNQIVSGFKLFTGSPWVANPVAPSGIVNLLYLSGASGIINTRLISTGANLTSFRVTGSNNLQIVDATGIGGLQVYISGTQLFISGGANGGGGGVTNNYFITGTGIVSINSNASGNINNTINVTSGNVNITDTGVTTNNISVTNGNVNNNYNISGITGNFVNLSFYYDPTTLATGLNNAEAFIGRSFTFTGYALGCINTGTQGYFSGSLYQRTTTNVKTNFINFSLNSGQFFTAAGGFNQTVSGMNRLGLDIYLLGTGITGLSVGVFGVGY